MSDSEENEEKLEVLNTEVRAVVNGTVTVYKRIISDLRS